MDKYITLGRSICNHEDTHFLQIIFNIIPIKITGFFMELKKLILKINEQAKLWCWRRLLRVAWTARRSNQSILQEISPGCSLEGIMLKLKLEYFGHLMRRADSLEKTLMLTGIGGRRRRGRQRTRWLEDNTYTMDLSLSKLQKLVVDREA